MLTSPLLNRSTSTNLKPSILILKSPVPSPSQDPYFLSLSPTHNPSFIPVLITSHVNLTSLRSLIASGSDGTFAGVILTSKRAVEAWEIAGKDLQGAGGWEKPFWVVGPSTEEEVKKLAKELRPSSDDLILGGSQTGTSESLATYIVSMIDQFPEMRQLPLLYLTGDKNAPTIPDVLSSNGVSVSSIQVYATSPISSEDFSASLDFLISSIPDNHLDWITFFSPSGVQATISTLRTRGMIEGERRTKIACIGPTTERYLSEREGVAVDAVAKKPEAEEIAKAVREAEGREDQS